MSGSAGAAARVRRGAAAARVPAPSVLVGAAVLVVCSGVAWARGPDLPLLVLRGAQLGLAGAAAYLLDDAVSALTGVVPAPLWRRRAMRLGAGVVLLGGIWTGVLLEATSRSVPDRTSGAAAGVLSLEVGVLAAVAVAASAVCARHGEPEPGGLVAPALALGGLGLMIVGPLLGFAPFPSEHGPGIGVTWWCWVGVGAAALTALAVASRDPASRGRPRRPRSR